MGISSMNVESLRLRRKEMLSDGIDYKEGYYDLLISKEKGFISEEKDWPAAGEDSDEEKFINSSLNGCLRGVRSEFCRLTCINLKLV